MGREHLGNPVPQEHEDRTRGTAVGQQDRAWRLRRGSGSAVLPASKPTIAARNEDDLTLALVYMRGAALSALGLHTAALDAFKEALAKTAKRDPALLATVRYDRALTYEQVGQKARAKADYERLYAADPGYRDVRDRLAAL